MFDYFSVNTQESDVEQFAILVSHKEKGALTKTTRPPTTF